MSEQVRLAAFTGELVTQRLGCNLPADENLFIQHYGPGGSNTFWAKYLFGVRSLPAFTHMLALTRAEQCDRIDVIRSALRKALVQAYQSDQTFFRGRSGAMADVIYYHEIREPETVLVIARSAADWLFAHPEWSHLVPETLARFLNPAASVPMRPALPAADDGEIIAALRVVYSASSSPPNLAEAYPLTVAQLRLQGKSATKKRVQDTADAPEFKLLRRKPGERSR